MVTAIIVFIAIHLLEIMGVLMFLLIQKNSRLEKLAINQSEQLETIKLLIQASDEKLKQMDSIGAFKSDDDIGWFFENIKEIQNMMNSTSQ